MVVHRQRGDVRSLRIDENLPRGLDGRHLPSSIPRFSWRAFGGSERHASSIRSEYTDGWCGQRNVLVELGRNRLLEMASLGQSSACVHGQQRWPGQIVARLVSNARAALACRGNHEHRTSATKMELNPYSTAVLITIRRERGWPIHLHLSCRDPLLPERTVAALSRTLTPESCPENVK